MTAIAGIWMYEPGVPVAAECAAMLNALRLYGGDDSTQYAGPACSMGRALLRLLPEDTFDQQPLAAGDVTAFVADVRLDNREELGALLGLPRDRLATMADSDVLLAAWLRWREDCVDHLCGAFAFAVWEQASQQLFLARDHTGERPLFFSANEHRFAFASMPKGLHALADMAAHIDEDYVARYLTLVNMPLEQTIFRGVRRLPAGCSLRVRGREVRQWRHWRLDALPELRLNSPAACLDALRATFDIAVAARLRTRGGIGAQLSGGLDSGAVAVTAATLLRAADRELICLTAVPRPGFVAPPSTTHFFDEAPYAAEAIAPFPRTRHLLVHPGDASFLDTLDRNSLLYDHPSFTPSNEVWSNAIYDQARAAGVTVLLNGNCGNATISYEGMPAFSAWFRSGQWLTLLRVARQLAHTRSVSFGSMARHALGPSLPFWLRRVVDPHMRNFSLDYSMLHPAIAAREGLAQAAFHDLNQQSTDGRSMLRRMLTWGDVGETAMAAQGGWQIDARDPTYDRRVVEFCLAVPLEEFLRGGQLRSLARRSMQGRLPAATLQRTQRGAQAADWYMDLGAVRGRMAAEVARLRSSPLASRLLDLDRMQALLEHWPTRGFEQAGIRTVYHLALTRGLAVGRFLEQHDTH